MWTYIYKVICESKMIYMIEKRGITELKGDGKL